MTSYCGADEFLRCKIDTYVDRLVIAVVSTKLFVDKSWIKSRGTATVTQAVICEQVTTPPYRVIFFGA